MDHILNTIIYRIKWQVTWFPFEGGRLIQVKITKKDKHGTAIGWPRPHNRGGRLTQVTLILRLYERKIGTLKTDRLIEGRLIYKIVYLFIALRELVSHQRAILRMAEICNGVIMISANQEEV